MWLCIGISLYLALGSTALNVNGSVGVNWIEDMPLGYTIDATNFRSNYSAFNLADERTISLTKSFGSNVWLRVGGTEADWLVYNVSSEGGEGDVNMGVSGDPSTAYVDKEAWKQLCEFVRRVGWRFTFGLNARQGWNATSSHQWNSSNAESLLRYSKSIDCPLVGVELGNELNLNQPGKGHWTPALEGDHFLALSKLLLEVYGSSGGGNTSSPFIFGPDSTHGALKPSGSTFFHDSLLAIASDAKDAGVPSIDRITFHQYMKPAQPLLYYLHPTNLDEFGVDCSAARESADAFQQCGFPNAKLFAGEAGIELNSESEPNGPAGNHVPGLDDGFAGVLVWGDRVGLGFRRGLQGIIHQTWTHIAYQSSSGSLYGIAPSVYASVLFTRLFGSTILAVDGDTQPNRYTRMYASCAKGEDSSKISVAVFNVGEDTNYIQVHVDNIPASSLAIYSLTPFPNVANVSSTSIALNSKPLALNTDGSLPTLSPHHTTTNNFTLLPKTAVFLTAQFQHPIAACEN